LPQSHPLRGLRGLAHERVQIGAIECFEGMQAQQAGHHIPRRGTGAAAALQGQVRGALPLAGMHGDAAHYINNRDNLHICPKLKACL
jgi:hypothetical protein